MRRALKVVIAAVLAILIISTYVGVATAISGRGGAWQLFAFGFGISAASLTSFALLFGSLVLLLRWAEK